MTVTTITATNNPATDQPAIQAAVDAAADGDTLLLRIGANGEDFDMGAAGNRVLIVNKTLTFAGDLTAGSKPTFKNGGNTAIDQSVFSYFNSARDKDIIFEVLKFKDWRFRTMFVSGALNATMRRCDLTQANWVGRTFKRFIAGANENLGFGLLILGTNKTGLIEDNTLDLFTDTSPADGTNLFTFGMEAVLHGSDSRVLVQRNVVRNASTNSFAQSRSLGTVEILNNFIDAADWIPGRSQAFTANPATDTLTAADHAYSDDARVFLMTTGTLPSPLTVDTPFFVILVDDDNFKLATTSGGSAIDITDAGTGVHTIRDEFNHQRVLHAASGIASIHVVEPFAQPDIVRDNTIVLRAKDQAGIFELNVFLKPPLGTRHQHNTIISKVDDVNANRPLAAMRVTGSDNAYVAQNTVIGQFKDGIRVESNFRNVPSSGAAVVGNNLTAMDAGDAELRFTDRSFNCVAAGHFRTVDDTGSNNKVTGDGAVSGGIGDVISDSEPGFMTEQEVE